MANDMLPSQLANSIMAKLYDVLTNGDETVPRSEDNFFSWCTPAIPIEPADFEFLTQGFTGVVKKPAAEAVAVGAPAGGSTPAGGGAPAPALSPDMVAKLIAQDVGRLYAEAESFSRLVDFVPDASGMNTRFATLNVMNNEGSLSDRYEYILRFSQVMQSELPAETVKKIEKFRGLLSVTTKKKNLIDDSETEVQEPSPLVKAYNDKLKAYEDAVLEYNSARINALAADDAKAVQYWALNAHVLRNRVKAAMDDWVANGYKNDYEQIAAFLDQVMQRDMTLLKQEYRDALDRAKLTGLASGSDFYYSALVPANWVNASGWTGFTFRSSDISRYEKSASNSWSAAGGFFGLGGSGSGSHRDYDGKFDSTQFSLSFSITQVPIVRPWFKTPFLASKAWRFDPSNAEAKGQMVSDGGTPPKGLIPAYPTSIVCVKDLTLSFGESSEVNKFVQDQINAGGFVSFGPFALGGHYSKGSSNRSFEYKSESQGVRVPGMQIVGFKCHLVPKSPDPLPDIASWA